MLFYLKMAFDNIGFWEGQTNPNCERTTVTDATYNWIVAVKVSKSQTTTILATNTNLWGILDQDTLLLDECSNKLDNKRKYAAIRRHCPVAVTKSFFTQDPGVPPLDSANFREIRHLIDL